METNRIINLTEKERRILKGISEKDNFKAFYPDSSISIFFPLSKSFNRSRKERKRDRKEISYLYRKERKFLEDLLKEKGFYFPAKYLNF